MLPAHSDLDTLAARLAEQVERPLADTVLATLPEAVRRGRLGEYLTDEEAQAETGLTARQLRHLRATRRLPYRKVGPRTVLYKTSELFALIDAGEVPARKLLSS